MMEGRCITKLMRKYRNKRRNSGTKEGPYIMRDRHLRFMYSHLNSLKIVCRHHHLYLRSHSRMIWVDPCTMNLHKKKSKKRYLNNKLKKKMMIETNSYTSTRYRHKNQK